MDVHEFLDLYEDDLKNGTIKEKCVGDIFDFLLEMASSDINAVKSQLIRLYMHLLKYKYQQNKQTRSWINSIRNASDELDILLENKSLKNKITEEMQKDLFKKARINARFETGLPDITFPSILPYEYNLDNLTNREYIERFLRHYAFSEDAKNVLNL